MTKKLLLTAVAVLVVLLLSTQVLGTTVFAAGDDLPKLVRLEMGIDSMTIRVNQQRGLWASIGVREMITINEVEKETFRWYDSSSREWPLSWTSSNPEVAIVDGDGMVTGISPGTTTITARYAATRRSESDKTATCTVTVNSSVLTGIELHTSNQEHTNDNSGERIDAARLRTDVEEAVKAAAAGEPVLVTYSGRTTVSTTALRSAAFSAAFEGREAKVRFRTLDSEGAIEGQLTFQPQYAPDEDYDIRVTVSSGSQSARNAAAMGKSYFSAASAAGVVLGHSGSYGMPVEVAASVSLPAGAQGIRLYRVEGAGYTPVEDAGCWLDASGYLHFTVSQGGTYVAIV